MNIATLALSVEEIASVRALGTGQVSDAMESLDMPRAVIVGLHYLAPAGHVMVGTAITIRQASKRAPAARTDRLVRHGELSAETARPGQVICMDAGGRIDVASWGENHSRRCLARGVAGLLTSGATRDVSAVRKLGFPVFCAGFSPIKSQWDLETAAIDAPITVGGVQIHPADIIFGDEDGIVVVPFAHRQAVFDRARDIQRKESARKT